MAYGFDVDEHRTQAPRFTMREARRSLCDLTQKLVKFRLLLDEDDKQGHECRVINVSDHGYCLRVQPAAELDRIRARGAECILELTNRGWLQVRVCWFEDEIFGFQIVRRLRMKRRA